jgi:multiple sugar transport system permease protein
MGGTRAAREARDGLVLSAPAIALLVVLALGPVLWAVVLGFHRDHVIFRDLRFVGLENYRFLLHDARFWAALGNTAYFAFVAVALETALGLAFALLLDAKTPGRSLFRAAVLVPWAIPTVVSAKLWAWLYHPEYGLVPKLLPGHDVDLLGTPVLAMHAAIVVDVWKSTPFVALLLLAGLKSIPRDVYLAARVDGASRARTFRSITLPLLAPTLTVTIVFRTLDAFRVFDAVYVLTDGGPAGTTETLSIYAYKTMMRLGDFGYGSALAIVTFAIVMAIAAIHLRALDRGDSRGAP